MPTIKTKKEMNLPELIEWIERNGGCGIFLSNKHNNVHVTDDGILEFFGTFYDDIFTVETEEEITEDTVILRLVEFGNYGHGKDFSWHYNKSINEELDIGSEAFYIMNDDKTMTLIWTKEKGLVE